MCKKNFVFIQLDNKTNMKPTLVEPGIKYFFDETLKQCVKKKNVYYNHIFNIVSFIIFSLAVALFLYVKYKSHNNEEEKIKKKKQEEEYMLNLVHKIQTEKRIDTGSKITDLPEYNQITKVFI